MGGARITGEALATHTGSLHEAYVTMMMIKALIFENKHRHRCAENQQYCNSIYNSQQEGVRFLTALLQSGGSASVNFTRKKKSQLVSP